MSPRACVPTLQSLQQWGAAALSCCFPDGSGQRPSVREGKTPFPRVEAPLYAAPTPKGLYQCGALRAGRARPASNES